MQSNRQIMLREPGRPSVLDEKTVDKLISVIKLGLSIETACQYAQINKSTFYRHLQTDPNFATKVADAKNYLILQAASFIYKILTDEEHKYNDSVKAKVAMFVLERREPETFGRRCKNCSRGFRPYVDAQIILEAKEAVKTRHLLGVNEALKPHH